jgi:NADH-quinone oxidoreductase subunit N
MTLRDILSNLLSILPLTFLFGWACALLVADIWIPRHNKGLTAALAAVGLSIALGFALSQWPGQPPSFGGMVSVDGFAVFLNVLFLGSGLFGIALAYDYLKRMGLERGEYYILLLFSVGGMVLMASAADLIVVFLALELLSLPLYVLSGIARPRLDSEEAALKYFLLGAFSGGIILYGVALVFGATGSTALDVIVAKVASGQAQMPLLTIGAALALIGLGFKVALVPFHMWTPDVYHGAPSAVTAFMAVGAKAGGFAALLRVFVTALPEIAADLAPVLWVLAALTMILGNLVAIAQGNIKRLLAYSSIAHAGYILMALVPYGQSEIAPVSVASALFYLLAYAFTTFGAWAVVIALEKVEGQGLSLDDYAGLGRKRPGLAAAMTVFMLSFIGIPPTLGFVGKFYVFRAAIAGGEIGLALIGVLTSLISAYYYLRVVVLMYMREGQPEARDEFWLNLTVGATAIGAVVLTFAAPLLFDWAAKAVLRMF